MTIRSKLGRHPIAVCAALVLAATALFIWTRFVADMLQARARVDDGSVVIQTRCGPIEYEEAGSGIPLLAVHGSGGGYDQGMAFARPLTKRGIRVIAMSRFGYLRTPLPSNASATAQADAHACLLDVLNIRRAAIVGASAGAPSSVQFALRHPQRCAALVLLVPALYVPRAAGAPSVQAPAGTEFLFETVLKSDFLFWAAIKLARSTMIRAILATPPAVVESADAGEQARVAQILDSILPVSPRRLGLLNDAAVTSSLQRYELERITAPALAISVADDLYGTFESARYTAQNVAGARFVGYPSGGHVFVGHQNDVVSEIAAFLK